MGWRHVQRLAGRSSGDESGRSATTKSPARAGRRWVQTSWLGGGWWGLYYRRCRSGQQQWRGSGVARQSKAGNGEPRYGGGGGRFYSNGGAGQAADTTAHSGGGGAYGGGGSGGVTSGQRRWRRRVGGGGGGGSILTSGTGAPVGGGGGGGGGFGGRRRQRWLNAVASDIGCAGGVGGLAAAGASDQPGQRIGQSLWGRSRHLCPQQGGLGRWQDGRRRSDLRARRTG